MIINANKIIGLKLISLSDGKVYGKIHNLIFDPEVKKITVLMINIGGFFSESKLVSMNDIRSIGENAVIIPTSFVIKKLNEVDPKITSIAKNETYITRTRVMTNTGTDLGIITDIYFDSITGQVYQFEITPNKSNKEIHSNNNFIDISEIETIGRDIIIVKPESENNNSLDQNINNISDKTII